MADLSMQQGQISANTQQNIWNTIGSTIASLPREVQQAQYYETLQSRQQQALEREEKARNREAAFTAGGEQFLRDDGSTDYDAWEQDVLALSDGTFPLTVRHPDDYAHRLPDQASIGQLRADIKDADHKDLIATNEDRKRVIDQRLNLSTEFARLAEGAMGFTDANEQLEFWQKGTGEGSKLSALAQMLDRELGGTTVSDNLSSMASVDRNTFFGFDLQDETTGVMRPPNSGDAYPFLTNVITEGMGNRERLAYQAQTNEAIKSLIDSGGSPRWAWSALNPQQQEVATNALANVLIRTGGEIIDDQADLDRQWARINEDTGGYLDANPGIYDALDRKGLLTFPTVEDVEANADLFEPGEAHTPQNLFNMGLRNSGVDSPLYNVDAVGHEVLAWGTGQGYPGMDRIVHGSPAWGSITRAYALDGGDPRYYGEYLDMLQERSLETGGTGGTRGSRNGDGIQITDAAVIGATRALGDEHRAYHGSLPTVGGVVSDDILANNTSPALEYMNEDGQWINAGNDQAVLTITNLDGTTSSRTVYSSRNPILGMAEVPQDDLDNVVRSESEYKSDQKFMYEKAMASVGAPTPPMMHALGEAFMDEISQKNEAGEVLGYHKDLMDIWPKRDGEFISFSEIQDTSPVEAEDLFIEFADQYGIDLLEDLYPEIRGDYTLEHFPRLMKSMLGLKFPGTTRGLELFSLVPRSQQTSSYPIASIR